MDPSHFRHFGLLFMCNLPATKVKVRAYNMMTKEENYPKTLTNIYLLS